MAEQSKLAKLTEALRLIAAPMRPDGTWNRDREACRQLAAKTLDEYDAASVMAEQTCRKCGGQMMPSKAIEQTYTGTGDFGRDDVVTLSPGGPGKLIDCLKCKQCGWSVTAPTSERGACDG